MKTKNILFTALAALAVLVSCNKEETSPTGDNTPKSITIALGGTSQGSRATGAPITTKTPVALSKAYVLFSNGTNLVKFKGQDGSEIYMEAFNDVAELKTEAGVTFHNLPAEVTEVIVVGNIERTTLEDCVGEGKTNTKTALEAITRTLAQESPANLNNLTLYGVSAELVPQTDKDDEAHSYFKATVELKPLVARLEIRNVQCTDLGTEYKKLVISQIALANLYKQVPIKGTPNSQELLAGVTDSYEDFFAENSAASGDTYDQVSLEIDDAQAVPTAEAGQTLCYHVFGGTIPEILARITKTDNNDATSFGYIQTSGFTRLTTSYFEAGKVYTVDLAFQEETVKQPDTKCIAVIVEVANWEVVPLTPTYD